jgi:hypothetical protein
MLQIPKDNDEDRGRCTTYGMESTNSLKVSRIFEAIYVGTSGYRVPPVAAVPLLLLNDLPKHE